MAKIMIVDDGPMSREVLGLLLQQRGHETLEAGSVVEAQKIDPDGYDAVICDGLHGDCWEMEDYCRVVDKTFLLYTGDDRIFSQALERKTLALIKPKPIEDLLAALQAPVGAVTR